MNDHDDDWLDAFAPADLADPELSWTDRAVDRLSRRPRNLRRWVAAGAAVALAAAALAWLASRPAPPPPVAPPAPAVAESRPPHVAPTPVPAPPAPAPRATPAPAPVVEASPPPRPEPGLIPADGAVVTLERGRAVVRGGVLTYVHDATHEPGVRAVAFAELPVVLEPVGTEFSVDARAGVGAVRVSAGTVRVLRDDGAVLGLLSAGDDAVLLLDPDAPAGVALLPTTALSLDVVGDRVPGGCLCRPRDVVGAVAGLRYLARSTEAQERP